MSLEVTGDFLVRSWPRIVSGESCSKNPSLYATIKSIVCHLNHLENSHTLNLWSLKPVLCPWGKHFTPRIASKTLNSVNTTLHLTQSMQMWRSFLGIFKGPPKRYSGCRSGGVFARVLRLLRKRTLTRETSGTLGVAQEQEVPIEQVVMFTTTFLRLNTLKGTKTWTPGPSCAKAG